MSKIQKEHTDLEHAPIPSKIKNVMTRHISWDDGFTLIELLIVLAIIGILGGTISTTLTQAKLRAQDSLVKQSLSSIRNVAEEVYFTSYPNTYLPVCFESMVDLILNDLSEVTGATEQNYQCMSSSNSWIAIFPLQSGGYWCSDGFGRSLPVDGFIEYSSPEYMDCILAVQEDPEVEAPPEDGGGEGSQATPVITLTGGSFIEIWSNSGNPFKGGAWHKFHEPGYSAYDAEDGDISTDVVVVGPTLINSGGPKSCKEYTYELDYTVTNSGQISSTLGTRTVLHHKCKQ